MVVAAVVGAENHLIKARGTVHLALGGDDVPAQRHARAGGGIGSCGAAQHRALQQGSVFGKVQPRDHRAHAVPEQKQRQIGIALFQVKGDGVQVLHQIVITVFGGDESQTGRVLAAFAVSQVVVSADDKAFPGKKAKERQVAVDVLAHAVRDLDNGAEGRCRFRQPAEQRLALTGGGQRKGVPAQIGFQIVRREIRFHGKAPFQNG